MSLNDKVKRELATVLNTEFDAAEVQALIGCIAANNTYSLQAKSSTPNFGIYLSGLWYDTAYSGVVSPTGYTGVADTIDIYPFFTGTDVNVDNFSVGITVGVAASNVRVVIYDSGDNYLPNRKIYESGNLSTATSTTVSGEAASFKFVAGKLYWIGVHNSSTATLRGVRDYASVSLGLTTNTPATGNNNVLRKTAPFGSAPISWGFTSADLAGGAPPSIRFRVV